MSDGKRVLYAANEERFSRIKNHGGFPHLALVELFRQTGATPEEVTHVAVAGILTPPLPLRIFPSLQHKLRQAQDKRSISPLRHLADFAIHCTPVASRPPGNFARRMLERILPTILARSLPTGLKGMPLHLVEHHPAHAFCAYYLSGFDEALAITADGMGDGSSWTVSCCKDGTLSRVALGTPDNSPGLFFESLTEAFGYIPSRDEGKLTGLAAYGNPSGVAAPSPFVVNNGMLQYRGPHGIAAVKWLRDDMLKTCRKEDIAAWAQVSLEEAIVNLSRFWMERTGIRRLVLGGGIFANVKLNQRLCEIQGLDEIFVAPNMGDGGNAVGALASAGCLERLRIDNVFFGDQFSEDDMEASLKKLGVAYTRMSEPPLEIAERLNKGKTVARFSGRMEWGPRALGNRSILAPATDSAVVSKLNAQLQRNDFMPFAPAMREQDVPRFLSRHENGAFAAEFMTVCFDCTDEMKALFPAVVHVDGTARSQIVRPQANSGLHEILDSYAQFTGHGVVLNTSFNIHEEPIVRTPDEAIRAYKHACLDYLALGPFLATNLQAVG